MHPHVCGGSRVSDGVVSPFAKKKDKVCTCSHFGGVRVRDRASLFHKKMKRQKTCYIFCGVRVLDSALSLFHRSKKKNDKHLLTFVVGGRPVGFQMV